MWDENCFLPDILNPGTTFTENCSFIQMNILHPSANKETQPKLSEFVLDCINNSGCYGYNDGVNTLLAAASADRHLQLSKIGIAMQKRT